MASSRLLVWLMQFAVLYLATLTAYRILMTWMFARTGSLLLAVLMHASYTGWLFVLFPATSFEQSLAWQTTLAAALWLVVGAGIHGSGTTTTCWRPFAAWSWKLTNHD